MTTMFKFQYILIGVIGLCLPITMKAQSFRAFENAAVRAFEQKDYYSSMEYYNQILIGEPERLDILYKYAESARLFNAYTSAASTYKRITELDKSNTYPDAFYWLGVLSQSLGKYDEAIASFDTYIAANPAGASLQQAQDAKDECLWALGELSNPKADVIIARLPEEPNTGNSEFGATQRGDTLYYSSFREEDWNDKHVPERPIVRVMEQEPDRAPVKAPFNANGRHTAHTAFSPEGNFMVYNQCDYVLDADIRCELYFSMKYGNDWGEGVKLPATINIPGYTTTQPSIVKDADGYFTLYYVSDCPGGKGGLDIWKTKFSLAGEFQTPVNLSDINTQENDVTPFFDSGTQTLYFSSMGYPSLGGYDIFKSPLDKGIFQQPENIGMPFNSSFNDLYFAMQEGDYAYFSSNRNGSATVASDVCCYDIFKGSFLSLKLETLAFSKTTGDPLDQIIFTLMEQPTDVPPTSKYSKELNNALFDIKRDKQYTIIASKEGYKPDTITFASKNIPSTRKFTEKLYLEPMDLALQVMTFNQFNKSPLAGVNIRLIEIPANGSVLKEEKNTKEGNETDLSVQVQKRYMIIGNKDRFLPDTAIVSEQELKYGLKLTKQLYLTPSSINDYLPISLYFDNDHPNPNSRAETTTLSYEQTYERYMGRREEFIRVFTKNMSGAEKDEAIAKINRFFDEDVKTGYTKLDHFANNLDLFLDNGFKVEIMVKGFASPLANSAYNLALTKRRIASVLNYLRKVRNGNFQEHINRQQLVVSTKPNGEEESKKGVSDNARDKRLSIYSVEASMERRSEIIEVRLTKIKSDFKN